MAKPKAPEPRQPGLPSLNRARVDRKRSLFTGRARIGGTPPQFWLWTGLGFVAFVIIYWKFAEGELLSQKSAVMARQRAIAQSLGPKISPFVGKIERWVIELATGAHSDFVAPDADLDAIRRGPGVYLRLMQEQARTSDEIRKAAARSLRDGFTSCLFIRKEPRTGERCERPADCKGGLLCNEWRVCARPSQPYNMRLAYGALRVLTPQWTDDLHEAENDLQVRAFELDLEAVTRNDIPVAVEVLTQAKFFTAVIDEKPEEGLPPPVATVETEGERAETEEERLQRVAHYARVGIWDLKSEEPLLRLRVSAEGQFVPVGHAAAQSAQSRAAQQRQVNNCALALSVKEALQRAQVTPVPTAEDGGTD